MTPSTPQQIAETFKNEGNAPFASGKMYFNPMRLLTQFRKGAIQKYSEAIQLTQTSPLYSNRAAALLKKGKFDAALKDALKCVPLALMSDEQGNRTRFILGKRLFSSC
jgi:tetratricopeptide (TPR) repeat protein